jgi:nucleoside-diphosphate-sugar epimerase
VPTSRISGATVLVAGGGGFIGSRVCAALAREGASVHALGRSEGPPHGLDARWVRADVADREAVHRAVARIEPELVVNLAGAVSAVPDRALMLPAARDHVLGAINLLDAALDAGVRRVLAAGSMVAPAPGPERPAAPGSPYAVAKASGTLVGDLYRSVFGLDVVDLRLFMVYGEGQDPSKVAPLIIESLQRGERPRLASGTLPLDWLHVDDAADAFVAAARAANPGERLDVASGERATVADLARRIASIMGSPLEPLLSEIPDRPAVASPEPDLSRTEAAIGWRASISLDEGLRRAVPAFSHGQMPPFRVAP